MKTSRQRGVALLTSLWIVLLLAMGSAVLLTRTQTVRQEQLVDRSKEQAFWAVEGALETARARLAHGTLPARSIHEIGTHRVELQVTATALGWRVKARTLPEIAATQVDLRRMDGALPRIEAWKALR